MDYQEFVERGQRARRETEDFINSYIHDRRNGWPLICHSGLARQELLQRKAFGACAGVRTKLTMPVISPENSEGVGGGRAAEQIGPKAG